jgi:4'-phosphopantetheinyl transferase EntD
MDMPLGSPLDAWSAFHYGVTAMELLPDPDPAEPCGGELFSRLFPREVGAASARMSDRPFPLYPEEAKAVGNAVTPRRIEFATGRHCARMAMDRLGHAACAIPSGPDRAPVWPSGLVGSITHSAGFCAAVVAPASRFRTIGIDTELAGAVPSGLAEEIVRPDEAAELDRGNGTDGADWPTLYFCLKEAAYKTFYPIYRRMIGFQDMRLRVNLDARSFIAELPGMSAHGNPVFHGSYFVRQARIYAACW